MKDAKLFTWLLLAGLIALALLLDLKASAPPPWTSPPATHAPTLHGLAR